MDQIITGSGQTGGNGQGVQDIVQAEAFQENAGKPFFRAFANPTGLLGRFASFLMSKKNMALNRAAVDSLGPIEGDSVLEIGFGPGKGLELLAEKVGASGFVGGVDISPLMVSKASGRNMGALAGGSVRLILAGADSIPWPDDSFERVLSVSNIQFWEPASVSFGEVLRVLRPGGLLVAAIHTKSRGQRKMTPGLYPEEVERLQAQLGTTGFEGVRTHPVPELPNELCLAGVKPSR